MYVLCMCVCCFIFYNGPPYLRPQVGTTWDGGKGAEVTKLLVQADETRPSLTTVTGESERGGRFTGVPRLESSDEGCVSTSDEQNKVFVSSYIPAAPTPNAGLFCNVASDFASFSFACTVQRCIRFCFVFF